MDTSRRNVGPGPRAGARGRRTDLRGPLSLSFLGCALSPWTAPPPPFRGLDPERMRCPLPAAVVDRPSKTRQSQVQVG